MTHATDDKNFRLPLTIRPRRYAATVTLDMEAKSFTGQQTIELELEKPSKEIILHAIALQLGEVRQLDEGHARQRHGGGQQATEEKNPGVHG